MVRRIIVAAAVAFCVAPAGAQVPLKPETPGLLRWTPEQQSEGYRSIETYYRTSTVARGDHVRPLAKGGRTIEPPSGGGDTTWAGSHRSGADRGSREQQTLLFLGKLSASGALGVDRSPPLPNSLTKSLIVGSLSPTSIALLCGLRRKSRSMA